MTKYIAAEGIVQYARIFADHYDDNMEYHEATQGQYNMNFYPDDVDDLIKKGFPEKAGNYPAFKDGDPNFNSGKYVKLKRPVFNVYLPNEDGTKGKLMGAPLVLNRTEDSESNEEWSFENDGHIGNGTRVKVLVSIYEGRSTIVTLEKVAILDHEPYEPNTGVQF